MPLADQADDKAAPVHLRCGLIQYGTQVLLAATAGRRSQAFACGQT
jgi:hypothetical protein